VNQLEAIFTQAGDIDGTTSKVAEPSFTRIQLVITIHKYITAKAKDT